MIRRSHFEHKYAARKILQAFLEEDHGTTALQKRCAPVSHREKFLGDSVRIMMCDVCVCVCVCVCCVCAMVCL